MKYKKLLLSELKLKCAERLQHLQHTNKFEIIQPINMIAVIKTV